MRMVYLNDHGYDTEGDIIMEAAAREPLDLPYSPTSPDVKGYSYVVTSDDEPDDSDT